MGTCLCRLTAEYMKMKITCQDNLLVLMRNRLTLKMVFYKSSQKKVDCKQL